jgi:hypothetical protein
MRCALAAATLVVLCATAHAEKDRKTAVVLSAASAGVSGAVVIAGFVTAPNAERINPPVMYTGLGLLFVTPSLGEFYAGEYITLGMGVRALATGLAVYTLDSQTKLATCDNAPNSSAPKCEVFTEHAYPLLGVAAIAFVGGVWYDVLDASDAVDRYNRARGLSVTPAVATPSGLAPGLSLAGSF